MLLSPLGAAYALSVRLRQVRSRPYRPNACVICVGNLTAGGSGKTPVALAIAEILASRGKTVFLSRGYGGRLTGPLVVDPTRHTAHEIGDEPLLLAKRGIAIVARNRRDGARLADELNADFIVMDDGFQNFSIEKDLSLLVVDAETGFGNGKIIPAGPLREPVLSGCARADAIILVGDGNPKLPAFRGQMIRAKLVPNSPESLRGKRVMAFAAIGRPQKFFDMLKSVGAEVTCTMNFADHHVFTTAELSQLKKRAQAAGAVLVTTEKDFARIPAPARTGITPVAVRLEFGDRAAVLALLARLLPAQKAAVHAG